MRAIAGGAALRPCGSPASYGPGRTEPGTRAARPSAVNALGNVAMGNLWPGRPVWAHGLRAGALLASGALVLSGCTGHPFAPVIHAGALRAADVALVRFTSCGEALRNLLAAAGNAVGPGGFAVGTGTAAGAGSGSTAGTASGGSAGAAPDAGVPAAAPAGRQPVGARPGAGPGSGA